MGSGDRTSESQTDEGMFRTLVEGSIHGILVHRNQRPLFVNQAWAGIHGLSVDEALSLESVLPFIHPVEQERILRYMDARLRGEDAPAHYEYRAIRKDGVTIWLENLVRPIEWEGAPAIQATIIDITKRKHAETALRESEERFRRGFEDGPIGVSFIDRDLRFLRANEAFCDLVGYSQDELRQLTILDLTLKEDLEQDVPDPDTIPGHTDDFTVRKRYVRKDGGIVWVRLSGCWLLNDDAEPIHRMSLVENVTDRVQARLAIEASERRFRNLVEGSIQGIMVHRDDRPLFVNEAWAKLLGYSTTEVLAAESTMQFAADHEHERLSGYRLARMSGGSAPTRYEYQAARKNGSLIWLENNVRVVDWDGRPAIQSTIIDCTQRKLREAELRTFNEELERRVADRTAELEQANEQLETEIGERNSFEAKLTESRALYESLVETIPLCVARKGLDGKFVFANQALRELMGKPLSEIIGKDDYSFSPKELADKYRHDDLQVIRTGELLDFIETTKLGEGDERYIHTQKTPIHSADGEISGTQLIFWDITDQVVASTQMKEAGVELELKNRDLTSLLYVISHDLKEPVRAIQSFSMLINERSADSMDERSAQFLQRVIDASDRMQKLLDDVLLLSRAQRTVEPTEQVDLREIIRDVLLQLQARIEESGAEVDIADNLPVVTGDRRWITQALQNLVANALKFTLPDEPPHVEIVPLEALESGTGIAVRDHGPGIPEEHHERIFELFQRAVSRRVEGTGAGLAIVRQVAERHQGRATVRNSEGGGAEFGMTFWENGSQT